LRKVGKVVRLAGRTARSGSNLAAEDQTAFTIPQGYWPLDIAQGFCSTNDTPFAIHRIEIDTDGSGLLRVGGTAISIGTNLRVDMTWIGA
jgi:hypothetical protein